MQYEIVFKSDGWCSCYTCLPQTIPATQTAQKVVAALGTGTGTGAPLVAQRLLTIATPKQVHNIYIHANNSKKLRNNTTT